MARVDSAGQWLMDNALHCKFLFGANYLMNLIRGACGRGDDRSYASLLTGWIRQENPFRRASPLIASRLKGREAEMDYPEEGEKSAFTPTEPSRARDFSRRISEAVDLLSSCSKNALFICAMAYDVSNASYLSFSVHNFRSIHIEGV